MEYRVEGMIRFHPGIQFKLDEPLPFISSSSGAQISLKPTNDSKLAVRMTLEADNYTAASESAERELERISSRLSYFKNVAISGCEVEAIASRGSKSVTYIKRADAKAHIIKAIELEAKDMKALAHELAKEHSQVLEGVISWWRVAISFSVPALRYIFLYSLMEFLFNDRVESKTEVTKDLTKWINCHGDRVQMHPPNKYRKKHSYTHYTYLRDSLHHLKATGIPQQEDIDKLLPKFQDFVRERIKERYGINYV